MGFTPLQQAEIDRIQDPRKSEYAPHFPKLEKRTVLELKARANIVSIGDTVEFAPESDYTVQERAYIEAVKPRTKWMSAIPELLERAALLESEGLSPVVVTEIIRGE